MTLTACSGGTSSAGSAPAGSAGGQAASASSQTAAVDWPKKTINFYCTHASGGDTDYMARKLASSLEKVLGVSIAVTSVGGSNGATCTTQYKDGPTDGYTFICGNTAALCGNKATKLVDFGYEAFEPVAIYGKQSGENIVTRADAPYTNLKELIDASKKKPNSIKFGISTGGGVYIESCVLKNLGGTQFNVVEAGDGATRLTALLGGEIDCTSLPYSTAADYIKSGKLKSLCTVMSKAPDLMPDQECASKYVPQLKIDTEYVILAPKNTNSALLKAMNDAILKVGQSDDWKKIVNSYCMQNPYVLNLQDTLSNLKEQDNLYMSYQPYL
ncbi:tripartite tricarboxylate transporter substrate binding protein [Caproiciproducens sp. NJN-50]|nr:tripartite tricarboxylate transporter substrate binding protein [Caproicibacter sp. BJN0012]QAT51304.1 tripartite tricarboxylate transporter substrate binding protein [Caproiciproducens sp. NJN-50]